MRFQLLGAEEGIVRVECLGDLTAFEFDSKDPMAALLEQQPNVERLILGLRRVNFVDSAGIGWHLGTHRRMTAVGGKFIIHSVNMRVLQTFSVLHLPTILQIAKDEAEALELMRRTFVANS